MTLTDPKALAEHLRTHPPRVHHDAMVHLGEALWIIEQQGKELQHLRDAVTRARDSDPGPKCWGILEAALSPALDGE